MKTFLKFTFIIAFLSFSIPSLAQFGVNYYLSNESFIGFNYEFNERMEPELRLGVNRTFDNLAIEGLFKYQFLDEDSYEFYGGAGLRGDDSGSGLVIPFGLYLYPFDERNFGFLIEGAPVLLFDGGDEYLRGSFGIRYRFTD